MPTTVLRRTAKDTLPTYDGELENQDITGFTIVLNVQRPDGTTFVKTANLFDPTNGKFEFGPFLATDFATPGDYPADINITDTIGDDETFGDYVIDVEAKKIP